jgi:hypothetical protein
MAEAIMLSTEYAGADLVGTMGTFYGKPDARFELAEETAARYQEAGIPLIAVDASPQDPAKAPEGYKSTWVEDALAARGVTVVRANPGGIAAQAQQGVGFAVAHGAEKVVRHEPEKTLMVNFAPEISAALDAADVLVIGRTASAEASLPPEQRRTERLAGWILQQTLKLPADALSGGRGYTSAGAETLAQYPANEKTMNNWIYLYENVLKARELGLRVGGLAVELTHPQLMVDEETDNPIFDAKRHMQFNLQLAYLLRRPEVNPGAADITTAVLEGLDTLPVQAGPEDISVYRTYLTSLEDRFAIDYGYEPVAR